MALKMSEDELWAKVTHLQCVACRTIQQSDSKFTDRDDFEGDSTYETYGDCCNDPYLEPLIISDTAVFLDEKVDSESFIAANPSIGLFADHWEYTMDEDFFGLLEDQGILVKS